jgi:hypothetical protein
MTVAIDRILSNEILGISNRLQENRQERSINIKKEMNIFNLWRKVIGYHQNYLEHILIIQNNPIARKLFDYHHN